MILNFKSASNYFFQNGQIFLLQKIAGDLRSKVPFEAIVPSESIVFPTTGVDSGRIFFVLHFDLSLPVRTGRK